MDAATPDLSDLEGLTDEELAALTELAALDPEDLATLTEPLADVDQAAEPPAPDAGPPAPASAEVTASGNLVRAKEAFFVGNHRVARGDLYDAADPLVVKRPNLFAPVTQVVHSSAGIVEQATAAPGEKRTRRTAKKAPATKKAGTRGRKA